MSDSIKKNPNELTHAPSSELLEEHGDSLYRFALLRVRSASLAEDLVQETLLSAIRKWQSFEGRAAVGTWLTAILRNKIIDHFRRTAREANVFVSEPLASVDERHFNALGIWNTVLQDWAGEPDKLLENRELYTALQSCISKLGDNARRVFTLRVVDGVPTEDVCKELEMSASNLGVILYRARMALRDCLEENWIGLKE